MAVGIDWGEFIRDNAEAIAEARASKLGISDDPEIELRTVEYRRRSEQDRKERKREYQRTYDQREDVKARRRERRRKERADKEKCKRINANRRARIKWRMENEEGYAERLREYRNRWRSEHLEHAREMARESYQRHRDEINEKQRRKYASKKRDRGENRS